MRERGVDLINVSSGGNVKAKVPVAPGYQVPFAREVRDASGLPVAVAGVITEAAQAEGVLEAGDADAVLIGRAALRNPNWPLEALSELGLETAELPYPDSYFRGWE